MDQRFKPSGRKPEINVSLQEMKKLEEKMKEWQGKLARMKTSRAVKRK